MKKLFAILMLILTISTTSQAQRLTIDGRELYYVSAENDTFLMEMSNPEEWSTVLSPAPEADTLEAYILISDTGQSVRTPLKKNDKIHYLDMMEGYMVVTQGLGGLQEDYYFLMYDKSPLPEHIIIWDYKLK